MATTYEEIYDLFSMSIKDYSLDLMYAATPTTYYNYVLGFLIKAISRFNNCNQDLEDRNDVTQTFNITLTTTEKVILSDIMVWEWLRKEIQNINAISLHLNDRAFRHYSEAQNLKEKSVHADKVREQFSQTMVEYGISNVDWDSWELGTYD